MKINLQNIEEQIFFNQEIYKLLPEFNNLFYQWQLSKRHPGLSTLGKRSVIDLLNALENKHIQILEEYFGEEIILNKISDNIVKHYESDLDDANLCQFTDYKDFSVYRNKDKMKVTFWR